MIKILPLVIFSTLIMGQANFEKDNPCTHPLIKLAKAFRGLPIPVIGRITDDALWFDMRCLEDEGSFIENLKELTLA